MPIEFTWGNTKDFWQQEQAILAYLILFGHTGNEQYLDMARRTEAFWNIFFLDREHRGMYFRVTDNGLAVLQGDYAVRGGHSDASGYHCFELNYLAHIYNRAYVAPNNKTDASFCLHFKPNKNSAARSINVLPDFMPPGSVQVERVVINGVPHPHSDPNYFQVELSEAAWVNVDVNFRAIAKPAATKPEKVNLSPLPVRQGRWGATGGEPMSAPPLAGKKIAVVVESQYIPGEIKLPGALYVYWATVD